MSLVVSHPTGSPFCRSVVRAAQQSGLLDSFWTTVATPQALLTSTLIPANARLRLGQRAYPDVPWRRLRLRPARETVRLFASRMKWDGLVRHETGWASVDQVYRALDRDVANYLHSSGNGHIRAVYSYEDGALDSFRAAVDQGARRLYDLPIAHWKTLQRILSEEAQLLPEWAPTMIGLLDSIAKRERKDEELRLADHVFVASTFTRKSVEDAFGPDIKLSVVPYGAPDVTSGPTPVRQPGEPLRILYAGHLAQRKGIAYLIAALRRLDVDWKLTLAGPRPGTAPAELDDFLNDRRCNWLGAVPHPVLMTEMSRSHAFVFPSLVEGFGMVLTEALAAGVPIITTPHTAGPDLITDGVEGFIVPIRSPDLIAERLSTLYDDEPLRRQMSEAARRVAAANPWSVYESRMAQLVAEEMS